MSRLPKIILVTFLLSIASGCGARKYEDARPASGSSGAFITKDSSTSSTTALLPWEVWPLSYDLRGNPIESRLLLQGDEFLRSGDRVRALEIYLKADPARLEAREREARAMRVASTQLALDKAKETLEALSRYFKSQSKSAQEVDGRFALLFAYAYGRVGDIDQSLAWFSRAARYAAETAAPHAANLQDSAEHGIRMLIRSLDDARLYGLGERWMTDSIVYPLVGQERKHRAVPGYTFIPGSPRFWEIAPAAVGGSGGDIGSAQDGIVPIGVLLPLSGPFAPLGKSMQQGMALAVETHDAQEGKKTITLEVRDDAGDAIQAAALARELIASAKVSMLAGPLLTDPALRVGEIARIEAKPMLAFSKSASFQTGDGVFRLGPTPESQVSSLIDAVRTHLSMSKFAIVYPLDPAGEEFARIFRAEVTSRNLEIVFERGFPKDDSAALLAISKELEELSVQGIFFPDSIKSAGRFFAYISSDPLKTKPRALGTAAWDNPLELQQSQAILDGAVYVTPFFAGQLQPLTTRFIDAYRAKYGLEPDFLAAQGYDAATLMLRAAAYSRAESTPLEEAFQKLGTYQGLTGLITVQPSGELTRQFPVVTFENGRVAEVVTAVVSVDNNGIDHDSTVQTAQADAGGRNEEKAER